MATPTSSSNRSKRKGTKPITQGQNPQRGNRQKVSNAQVTNSGTRGSNAGSAKVTTGRGASAPKPADPWKAPTTKNSRTSAPKSNTTFRTQNTPLTLPNSRAQGKNLPRAGAQQLRSTTQGPRPSGKPPAKPSGNFKAPNIPKPGKPAAKPSVSGVRRVGGGLVSGTILTAAAGKAIETLGRAAQPSEWNRVQRELQARGYGGRKPVNKDPNGRSSTGVRVSDNANQRDYKAAPTGSKQYNDYRNRQMAAERDRLKGVGNPPTEKPKPPAPPRRNPSAPAADQRGGNNTAPRSQTPPAPRFTGTVDEGRKMWAEKFSSSKYEGQAIQKEAKKLLDEMKKRKEDKSNAQRAGWDGNKNY